MNQKKTGELLRELRKERGLTQEQVAEKFNTTNRSVSRWENGSTMPDISILVELADFYEVDIRELIDGKRDSREQEPVKEVARKMADYAEAEKDKLLTFMRGVSLTGVVFLFIALILLAVYFQPQVMSFAVFVCMFVAFLAMAVMTLYTNGILKKITANRKIVAFVKVFVACTIVIAAVSFIRTVLVLGIVMVVEAAPSNVITGIEHYDKAYYLENYGGDLDSLMLIFPEQVDLAVEATFESKMDTGLFDTSGYILLCAEYEKEQFEKEKARLSEITCTIYSLGQEEESVTKNILYDENSYSLPAYVTCDGFRDMYEYALIDEENFSVTYVYLSYPEPATENAYKNYLKCDLSLYNITDSFNQFTIYAHSFDGGEIWTEASDTVE